MTAVATKASPLMRLDTVLLRAGERTLMWMCMGAGIVMALNLVLGDAYDALGDLAFIVMMVLSRPLPAGRITKIVVVVGALITAIALYGDVRTGDPASIALALGALGAGILFVLPRQVRTTGGFI